MKKINKFGVITRPSTYLGCNNVTTFFFDPLPKSFLLPHLETFGLVLLLTENQFKVVFRVNLWLHYQIGHTYKEDEFILSIWICILSNQTSPLGTIPQAAKG